MLLEDFMMTDTYKTADCVEYVGSAGIELEYKEYFVKMTVNNYQLLNGCLIIELKL